MSASRVDQLSHSTYLRCRLAAEDAKIQELARLFLQKTGGNPFFTTQLLRSLYEKGLVNFETSSGRWQWSAEQIAHVQITANVSDLMADKIKELPEDTQRLLKLGLSAFTSCCLD